MNVCVDVSQQSDVTQTAAIRFIKFSIDFALTHQSIGDNFPKLPFLLIEDLLEYQTISQAKRIWTVIESLVEKITNPILFNKGKVLYPNLVIFEVVMMFSLLFMVCFIR